MTERTPPPLARWLLRHWGGAYHRDSLEGDLIEQYQEGRSRLWYWRQVAAAILIAQGGDLRALPWAAVTRVLFRCLAEAAALIAVLAVADRSRRTHSFAELMSGGFVGTLAVLVAVASISVLVLIRTQQRRRRHALVNTLMLLFGVIVLGAGTLTWAQSTRGDDCAAAACACRRQ
jgi:lysylphosphatidylglycerol synthetase-like protein (DUF2156 family)